MVGSRLLIRVTRISYLGGIILFLGNMDGVQGKIYVGTYYW